MERGPVSIREDVSRATNGHEPEAQRLLGGLTAHVRASSGVQLVPPDELGPISPELILVAPPELARLARELLPDLPLSYRAPVRREVVPLPVPAVAPVAPRTPHGVMAPPAEPPYSLGRIARGSLALAVGAALFAAGALAADRLASRDATVSSPSQPRAAAPIVSAVAGVSAIGGVGVAGDASRQGVVPRPDRPPKAARAAATTKPSRRSVAPATRTTAGSVAGTKGTGVPARSGTSANPVVPASPAPSSPLVSDTFVPSRVFAWAAVDGASAYDVRFFRNGGLVLELHPSTSQVTLPAGFRFQAGLYRWRVTPLLASGRRGTPVVDSAFRLSTAIAAQANSTLG
jgi:hypothetical protein